MNYQQIYNKLIDNARIRERDLLQYYEKHHIVPRCLGGTDEQSNLVYLTGREHFIAHLCLVKANPGHNGLVLAAMMMSCETKNQDRSKNRIYEWLRIKHRDAMGYLQSGEKNSQFGTAWIYSLDRKETKKVPNLEIEKYLNEGWKRGRVINFQKAIKTCVVCNIQFVSNTRTQTCNDTCEKKLRTTGRVFDNREEEFKKLYKDLGSMNKALKAMGFPGAVAQYYEWAKSIK